MPILLRDYQDEMLAGARQALRTHRKVLLQAPTGAGKTAVAAKMAENVQAKGRRAAFLVHRRELITQSAKTFTKAGVDFGVVAAGVTGNRHAPIQICSIQTLSRRLDLHKDFDLIVVDEAHHATASTWSAVIEHYAKAKVVGLSATPERSDGTGLDKMFDVLVPGPRVSWLIEQGYLSRYRLFAPSAPDLTGIHSRAGDYARDELAEVMDKPSITGDAVTHYSRIGAGRRAMVFCVSIKHSLHTVERFQAAGFRAAHIDGETDPAVRDALIAEFAAGRIQVLSSVDLVSEGFDVPEIEIAILLRPTKSLSLFLQQIGRCLRPVYAEGFDLTSQDGRLAAMAASDKPEAVVLDHAGNALQHGLPDDDRVWSLTGRQKRKRAAKDEDEEDAVQVRQCPMCYSVHRPEPTCPRCGFTYPTMGRSVKEVEGELQELQRNEAARARKVEVARAQTLDELIAIGRSRGYKNPSWWAKQTIAARDRKLSARYGPSMFGPSGSSHA